MPQPHDPATSGADRPDAAHQARTAMASARVASLLTYPRAAPARPHLTNVAVEHDEGGRPMVRLATGALAVTHLTARPLATVQIAPVGHPVVTVHGAVHRLPGRDDQGRLLYRVDIGAVRLAHPGHGACTAVNPQEYVAARPDPLAAEAPAVLAHLRDHHAAGLAACLRARGHDAHWVEPRSLDAAGLDVLAVGADGVELVRLAFPAPISRLQDLRAGLAIALTCRCAGDRPPRTEP